MSNINDNNLDDLLRRAAEKYPLRTDSADFGKLVADLEKDPSLILPPMNVEDRRRRRRFFWLFLLLPLGGGAYFAWHAAAGRGHTVEVAPSGAPKAEQVAGGERGTGDGGEKVTAGGDASDGGGKAVAGEGKAGNGKIVTGEEKTTVEGVGTNDGEKKAVTGGKANNGEKKVIAGDKTKDGEKGAVTGVRTNDNEKKAVAGGGRTIVGKKEVAGKKETVAGNGNAIPEAGRRVAGQENAISGDGKGRAGKGVRGTSNDSRENSPVASNTVEAPSARKVDSRLSLAGTRGTVNVNIPVKARATEVSQQSTPQKDKEKTKLQKPKPSFYVGILGSPDLSTIKMQSVKSVGHNFGLLLGYSFNSRWGIETGLYYDRKKYYTDGEYFSKSKVWWLNNYNLKTVDGYCDMWEIPLNVRYNLSTGGKMKWFATAGLSNYLMSKEQYTFDGTDASGNPWGGTWPYKKPYKYWFSIFNLSAGFEQPLGKIGNLRLEPYVRVPLSGIGTGSLSIMSAGLNIGITRRIW